MAKPKRTVNSMTTLTIEASAPVGQIARFFPSSIAVFETMDIEFACKGGRSLADAALAAGADLAELLTALRRVANEGRSMETSVADLIHTIVTEHHRIENEMLRDIDARLAKLRGNEDVARIRRIVANLTDAIHTHMLREERELFPRIEELDLHPHRIRAGSISRPLLVEFVEHDVVHERLVKVRELTLRLRGRADDETIAALERFDLLTHRHIHLENNVLIPRVIDLENRLKLTRRQEAVI